MRGLHEIVPVQDTVCSGLGAIERLGGNLYRFWFYVEQTDDETGGMERIVVTKLVAPASAVPDAVLQTIAAMTGSAAQAAAPLVADLMN